MTSSKSIQISSRSGSKPFSARRDGTSILTTCLCVYTNVSSYRIVPNYELSPDLENVEILRVVVRENMSEALIDRLVADLVRYSLVFSDTCL